MSKRVRAAVIGLGVGERHAHGYVAHPDCRLVTLCDQNQARLDELGGRFPGCRLTTDADAVLADPGIEIVSICSYDDAHYRQAAAGLAAGKHLMVEKPLCCTRAELADLRARRALRPDLHLSANMVLRRSPRFLEMRGLIAAGCLGRIYQIDADYNYGRLHKLTEGWRGRLPGYSVMLGGGIHMIDLVLWLTGGRVEAVSAFGSRKAVGQAVDDSRIGLLRFEDGTLAKISANFACVYPHSHRLSIYGTAGTLESGPEGARLYRSRDPGVAPTPLGGQSDGAKDSLIGPFVDAVLGRAPLEVDAAAVFATMEVGLALDQAADTGCVVSLPASPSDHASSSARETALCL